MVKTCWQCQASKLEERLLLVVPNCIFTVTPTSHMRTAQISCCHSLLHRSLASPSTDKTGVCKCGYTEQHNSGNAMDKLTHEWIISDTHTHTVFKSVTMLPTISKLVFMQKQATSTPSNFNPSITASLHCAIFNPTHAAGLCALHQVNVF